MTLRYLDERPADADWLEPEERDFLTAEVEREREREALGAQRCATRSRAAASGCSGSSTSSCWPPASG